MSLVQKNSDTIVAIATAQGEASLAVIKLSGINALDIAIKITNKKHLTPRHATLVDISVNSEFIDKAIAIYFKAPHSFTGEDIVEIQTHGGYIVSKIILEELVKLGARVANGGEFSKRAYLNGKIDLLQAEAISQVIAAKSKSSEIAIAKIMNGELNALALKIRESILSIIASIEVTLDYAEDDLPKDIESNINEILKSLLHRLDGLIDGSLMREARLEGYNLAIVGKPNVGKSSILNSMLGYERAIVSDEAGTTRDSINESLVIDGHYVTIVDTAGIRETLNNIESSGIQRSLKAIDKAHLVIGVFDGSMPKTHEDENVLEAIAVSLKPAIFVLNKIDLPLCFEATFDAIRLSTKQTVKPLIEEIGRVLKTFDGNDEEMLTTIRQVNIIKTLKNEILEAKSRLDLGEFEVASYLFYEAIKTLNTLTHEFDNEEMLDVLFGSFCVGK